MMRRLGACVVAAVLVTPLVSSCSDDESKVEEISLAGEKVKEPKKILSDAWSSFSGKNQTAVDAKSATLADDANCFFRRESKDSTTILPKVFCGPIKRVGSTDSRAWDVYGLATGGTDDPGATDKNPVFVSGEEQKSSTVDTSLLIRPDDKKPSNPKSLAAPKAPRTDKKDFAVLAPEAESGFDLKRLDRPAKITTPSATIEVEAQSSRSTLPAWVVRQSSESADEPPEATPEDGDSAEESSKAYRPAAGQSVKAYRISIGPGPGYPDHNSESYETDGAKDASTQLSLGVGGQQLSIVGQTRDDGGYDPSAEDRSTFTVECTVLPCQDADRSSTSYLLVTSHAKGSKPDLTATVDGKRIRLPLDGSKPSSSVSEVLTKRKNRTQQVNATFPETETTVRFGDDDNYDEDYTFSGGVPNAFLTSFDRAAGWAPKGKAWLEVPLRDVEFGQGDFKINYPNSFWIKVGDKRIPVKDGVGSAGTLVFEVPETFTKGTLAAQPQGSIKAHNGDDFVTKKFKQAKALTVPINIEAG